MSLMIWKLHDSVGLLKQYLQKKKKDHVYERPSENGLNNNMDLNFLKILKKNKEKT